MDPRYSDWLRRTVPTEATWRTKLSELRRIEATYGDLDAQYDADGLEGILSDVTYSAGDARRGVENPSRLEINGDLRNNLASYKSALSRYIRFKEQADDAPLADMADDDSAPPMAPQTFGLEADLQSALRANIAQLGADLSIIDGGGERRVDSGFIDILCRDGAGASVVIELKAVQAPPATLAQVLGYMGDLQAEDGGTVTGLIVAPDFHPRLVAAARMVPAVQLIRYHFAFSFERHGLLRAV